jgi:hypothetical protein
LLIGICFIIVFLIYLRDNSLKPIKMAKVKFTAMVAEVRGKLAGTVFSRNRGGNYIRTKVTPLNPQTGAQVAIRALLTQFAQAWRGLTEEQRESWRSSVSNWATTDVFGDLKNPSGSALYNRLNINIVNAGGSAINTPPSPTGAVALSTLDITSAVTGDVFTLDFDPTPVPAGHALVVEATAMLSPGIQNANSQFRQIGVLAAASATGQDMFTAYTTKFGALVAGQRVVVRARLVNLSTGEKSQSLVATVLVGA